MYVVGTIVLTRRLIVSTAQNKKLEKPESKLYSSIKFSSKSHCQHANSFLALDGQFLGHGL
jgi:hypothetical protein